MVHCDSKSHNFLFFFAFFLFSVTLILVSLTGASRPDPVWLHTAARICLGLTHHKTRTKEEPKEGFLQVCISCIFHLIQMLGPSLLEASGLLLHD